MLNPLLLWFLPLALIPIALHLITLHRLRTVELSTFRFLMDSYVQQRRRVRLLEFLVMLLRLAFVVLIIFAMSRPVIQQFGFLSGGASGRDVTVIVDAGPSMALRTGLTTSLERARGAASGIVKLLGSDDHLRLIRAGGEPKIIAGGFAGRAEKMLTRLNDLKTDAGASDLPAALQRVIDTRQHGPRYVYILSDGLRRSWQALQGHPVLEQLDDETQLVVMNVGPTEPVVNVAVVGEPPGGLRAVKGLPVLLRATVANTSPEADVDVVMSVLLDEELVTQVNLSLQPGQRETRPVSVTPTRAGVVRGRFEVPADAFPDDDTFLFTLNVQERINVLVVTGPESGKRADRPGLYVEAALESPLDADRGLAERERKLAAALEITRVAFDKLRPPMLEASDVVMLADVPLDANRAKWIRKYVEDGGGVLVMPGEHVNPDDYNTHLLRVAGEGAAGSFGYGQPTGDADDEANFKPVTALRLAHPVLSAFAEDEADYFSTVRMYRYFPITPPQGVEEDGEKAAAQRRPNVLMRLPDGTPLLAETRLGEGRLLMAGWPATPNWSNLPLKPEFVPLLLRATAHLQRTPELNTVEAVAPHQPAPVQMTDRWADAQVQVTDPAGRPHKIELHRSDRKVVGAMTETGRKGYYNVEVLPRAEDAPERLELGFAVNLEDQQSDFTMLDEPAIREMLGGREVTYLRGSAEDPVLARQLTEKHEIWRTLILITFLVIGMEFLLATLRPKQAPTPLVGQLSQPRGRLRRFAGRIGDTINVRGGARAPAEQQKR